MRDENSYIKWLTVKQLKAVLDTLPDDTRLVANQVGNLAAYNEDSEFIGWINFLHEGEFET